MDHYITITRIETRTATFKIPADTGSEALEKIKALRDHEGAHEWIHEILDNHYTDCELSYDLDNEATACDSDLSGFAIEREKERELLQQQVEHAPDATPKGNIRGIKTHFGNFVCDGCASRIFSRGFNIKGDIIYPTAPESQPCCLC